MPYEPDTNGHGYRWSSPEPIGGPGARHRATSAPRRASPVLILAVLGALLIMVSVAALASTLPRSARRRRPVVAVTTTVRPGARPAPRRTPSPAQTPSPVAPRWSPTGPWPWP
jgi:hypothetical protein